MEEDLIDGFEEDALHVDALHYIFVVEGNDFH